MTDNARTDHKPDCRCPACVAWDVEQCRKALRESSATGFHISRDRLVNLLSLGEEKAEMLALLRRVRDYLGVTTHGTLPADIRATIAKAEGR